MGNSWKDEVVQSLQRLGGNAKNKEIYLDIEENASRDISSVKDLTAIIRDTLERNSSDSSKFKYDKNSEKDLFYAVSGLGKGHWGLRKTSDYEDSNINLTPSLEEFEEGKQVLKVHLKRERNPKLIQIAKKRFKEKHGKLYCEACNFNFKDKYNINDVEFIEAHHLKPVSELKEGEKTKIEDIVMLCPNCHRMIHKYRPWIDKKEDIKKILK